MTSLHLALVLVSLIVGLLIGVITWSQVRSRRHNTASDGPETRDDLLVAFLVLAAFGLGVFVTYVLLGSGL